MDMPIEAAVVTHSADRVGHILLNRPKALNAITTEMAHQLEQALTRLSADVDVIVIRGAAGNFSAGGDFNEVARLRAEGAEALAALFDGLGRACTVIADIPVPVVAAVEGYALAGGFELMQACDIAIVRHDAQIGDNHSNHGLVPAGGGSQRLPRLIGRQRALALMLTGDRISGAEAAAWGLAYRAVPADDFEVAIEELATRLAGKSRPAQAHTKRMIYAGLEVPLAEGLALERACVLEHLLSAEGEHGIESFAERQT
jgi:enoyl-CoA hydratase/carnithine racemase